MEVVDYCNKIMFGVQSLFVVLPMKGYIFPDEFFQSSEIMASDILNFNTTRTWEWNSHHPARNIIFPFLSSGLPFILLKEVQKYFNIDMVVDLLLIAPRLFMLLVTLLIDRIFQFIYTELNLPAKTLSFGLLMFRTSFITLVFLPRTFSNTFETLFFAVIIYVSIKLGRNFSENLYLYRFLLGILIAVGTFVRITMIAFAFIPVLYIFYVEYQSRSWKNFIVRTVRLNSLTAIGFLLGCSFCITCDNYYFQSKDSVQITPLNLLLYNIDPDMLKKHGHHPKYLNFTVNMFLLFGPVYLLFLFVLLKRLLSIYSSEGGKKKRTIDLTPISDAFSLLVVIPVFVLSFIAHQEPRYIIPVILPIVITISLNLSNQKIKMLFVPWLVFNSLGVLWYGFLHQGGIIPALSYLNKELKDVKPNLKTHIIFWRTFMPPKHLLAIDKNRDDVFVYDFMGMETLKFQKSLEEFYQKTITEYEQSKFTQQKLWLICPSSKSKTITNAKPLWKMDKKIFPHISMENPPDFNEFFQNIFASDSYAGLSDVLVEFLSLNMYSRTVP